ncbi:MAG: ABC transporter permease [Deltaproteobacteria bacterium]|jgi:putative ABC transport system permease protein|nr:ABC transporter permease [Deltaproteobacteria bacterium]
MLQLALTNLQGRTAYSSIIVAAVAAAVVMTLVSLFVTGNLRQEVESKRRMLGPDLALVPKGSKERGHIYLSKGPPVHDVIPAGTLEQLGAFPEVEAAAPQKRLGLVTVGSVQATLFGFDPATDFIVRPWLDPRNTENFPGRNRGLALGALVPEEGLAQAVDGRNALLPAADGHKAGVGGRLLKTGSFMDTALFIPRPADDIALEPTWILVRLRQGTLLDVAANRLEVNIPGIEILLRPEMFKSLNDQLYGLVEGGAFGTASLLAIIGALLVTGAMFALMAHERKREFGLLKAMGARNGFVFKLIMAEASLLGSTGAALGIVTAAVCLLCVYLVSPDLPAILAFNALRMLAATLLILAVTVLTALWPALAATRLEPYVAIRSGE